MPTPKKIRRDVNLVDDSREVAESFLKSLIVQRIVPQNFSGLLTPRFGKHIMIWQFSKLRLVGAAMVNVANIPIFTKKLIQGPESYDWSQMPEEAGNGDEPSPS